MWSEGDSVLWRSVAFGHVRFAMPHRLVASTSDQVVLWVPPGTLGKRFAGKPLSEVERLDENDWALTDWSWRGGGCLRVTRVGRAHSIVLFWSTAWEQRPG